MIDIFDIKNRALLEADDDDDEIDFTKSTDIESEADDGDKSEDTEESTDGDGGTGDNDTDFTDTSGGGDGSEDGAEEGGEEDEESSSDTEGEDGENMDDEMGEDSEEESKIVNLKQLENDMYKNISKQDIAIRTNELKKSYNDLYDFINTILDRITEVKKSNINLRGLEYCETRLLDLKDQTYNYIIHNFAISSYIENQLRYKRILFTISKIIDLLNKISKESGSNK